MLSKDTLRNVVNWPKVLEHVSEDTSAILHCEHFKPFLTDIESSQFNSIEQTYNKRFLSATYYKRCWVPKKYDEDKNLIPRYPLI